MTIINAKELNTFIGARIKSRRKHQKITQTVLGKLLGVSFQQVQKYESGANRTSAANLYLIAKFLNVPMSYFYEDVEPVPETALVFLRKELAGHDFKDSDLLKFIAVAKTYI